MREFSMIDFTTRVVDSVRIAQSLIADAEAAAIAEMKASAHTNCHQCQAGLANFFFANPEASETEIDAQLHETWQYCGDCQVEYFRRISNVRKNLPTAAKRKRKNSTPILFGLFARWKHDTKRKGILVSLEAQDYFLERPVAVICKGCGKLTIPKGKDAAFMRFEGYQLVECSECQRLAKP